MNVTETTRDDLQTWVNRNRRRSPRSPARQPTAQDLKDYYQELPTCQTPAKKPSKLNTVCQKPVKTVDLDTSKVRVRVNPLDSKVSLPEVPVCGDESQEIVSTPKDTEMSKEQKRVLADFVTICKNLN